MNSIRIIDDREDLSAPVEDWGAEVGKAMAKGINEVAFIKPETVIQYKITSLGTYPSYRVRLRDALQCARIREEAGWAGTKVELVRGKGTVGREPASLKVGDKVWYWASFGVGPRLEAVITRVGEKDGWLVYDCETPAGKRWGYADQFERRDEE